VAAAARPAGRPAALGLRCRLQAFSDFRPAGCWLLLLAAAAPASLTWRKDIFHDSESQPTLFMTLRANLHFS
jgi:hypothetical protein